jgi:hypothetical protein
MEIRESKQELREPVLAFASLKNKEESLPWLILVQGNWQSADSRSSVTEFLEAKSLRLKVPK